MTSKRSLFFLEGKGKRPTHQPKGGKPPTGPAGAVKEREAPVKSPLAEKTSRKPKLRVKIIDKTAGTRQYSSDEGASVTPPGHSFRSELKVEIANPKDETPNVVSPKDVSVQVVEPVKRLSVDSPSSANSDSCDARPVFRLGGDSESADEHHSDSNLSPSIAKDPTCKGDYISPPVNISTHSTKATEDASFSSSGFSPCSTSASFKSFDGRNRIDDFSDDSDCPRLRESIDLSDDAEVASITVPLNRQLRVVTSLEPTYTPSRKKSASPVSSEAQTGGELIRRLSHHLMFVDYLRKRGLSSCLNHFPPDMTIDNFR
jgi:hypothetical protein